MILFSLKKIYIECRSSITNSPIAGVSSENVVNGIMVGEATTSTSDWGASSLKVTPLLI